MALRWRANGDLVCAATTEEEEGDRYMDDHVHDQLANGTTKAIVVDVNHHDNAQWHWTDTSIALMAVLWILSTNPSFDGA